MLHYKILLPVLLLLNLALSTAQSKYEDYQLQAPLDMPLLLSGNFAELRSHHFHAGLDFKTQGSIGHPIYAPADGYVSRINISTAGYGKALYIDHPELKLTTVYGHLNGYIPEIDSIAKCKHYELEKYNIDFFLEKDAVKVKKGQLIAYSGNTGSSGGPHLHFETRERSTQDPINPLLFGFDVKDTSAPIINGVRIYPVDGSVDNQTTVSKFYPLTFYGNAYHLKGNPTIKTWGKVGFAVNTIDYLDGSWNKCGIYSIELRVDSLLIYEQTMDRISYSEMRFIDAHIDQETRSSSRKDYQYSFKAKPNNKLSIYKTLKHEGVSDFSDNKVHQVNYTIKDTHGNVSKLQFNVQSKQAANIPAAIVNEEPLLAWKEAHRLSNHHFKLSIPARAMYEDQHLSYTLKKDSQYLAPVVSLDNDDKLFNKKATLCIRPDSDCHIPIDKMLIAKVNNKGQAYSVATTISDKTLSTKIYQLGTYTVVCDTVAPTIKAVNIYNNKQFTGKATFGFKVKDDFSGMWDYTATIDGEWALFYFEHKQNYVYYTIDPSRLEKGKTHQLEFKTWDATGNTTAYECQFKW